MSVSEIPLKPSPQSLQVTLHGVAYKLTLKWNIYSKCWVMDVAQASTGVAVANGLPLVTGADLVGQLQYLGFNGGLFVVSDQDTDAVPNYKSLGVQGHLLFADAA